MRIMAFDSYMWYTSCYPIKLKNVEQWYSEGAILPARTICISRCTNRLHKITFSRNGIMKLKNNKQKSKFITTFPFNFITKWMYFVFMLKHASLYSLLKKKIISIIFYNVTFRFPMLKKPQQKPLKEFSWTPILVTNIFHIR